MKALIADKFPEAGRAAVARAGVEIVYDPELNDAALTAAVRSTGADILVVRGTKVPAATLAAGRLSLVVRAGAGYDTIDVPAASARGIYVSNCPGKNSIAVAELTFALLLALDRRIPANAADLKAGRWNKAEYSKARGLFGRTLGLVGLGRIGQEVLGRARAFGMPVVAWSPSLTPERAASLGVRPKGSPAEVAAACDMLSIHVALTSGTRHLIDRGVLGALRPGSYFINTARAEVVHHYDRVGVLSAVFSQLKHAGINVQETENVVFEGAAAAVARIHLDSAPPQAALDAMRAESPDIIELSVLKL